MISEHHPVPIIVNSQKEGSVACIDDDTKVRHPRFTRCDQAGIWVIWIRSRAHYVNILQAGFHYYGSTSYYHRIQLHNLGMPERGVLLSSCPQNTLGEEMLITSHVV